MKKHLDIRVMGMVQGVFFRATCQEKAQELGICGYVQNEADGSVYIEAEGTDKELKELLSWCQNGPEMAQVSEIETHDGPVQGFEGFEIKR